MPVDTITKTKGKTQLLNRRMLTPAVCKALSLFAVDSLKKKKDIEAICNNALIHGCNAGLSVCDANGKPLNNLGDWNQLGKELIVGLREAVEIAISFASKVTFLPNNTIQGKDGSEEHFCALWTQFEQPSPFVHDVFNVTLTYLPIKMNRRLYAPEYASYLNLLSATITLLSAVAEYKTLRTDYE
jgi:hypothetical protein